MSEEDDLVYKCTNTFFSFENVSFIAPGAQLTSTAITLLNLMLGFALPLLCRSGRRLSTKYQTDTQPYVRTTQPSHNGTTTSKPLHAKRQLTTSLPYFPLTKYERRNLFHFPFSLWFQKSLAKIKQRERYKNYRKGLYRSE